MVVLGFSVLPQGADAALIQGKVAANLLYLGLFCSAAAYYLYLYALQELGTAVVTSFINLIPVFGVLGGAILLKEAVAADSCWWRHRDCRGQFSYHD